MSSMHQPLLGGALLTLAIATISSAFVVVDTSQEACFDTSLVITCPAEGSDYYGQDAQYSGPMPGYTDHGDGTVTDHQTGLMWQQDPGEKMTYDEAKAGAPTFDLAGYTDWRLPTIKELYSLIRFDGTDPSGYGGSDTSFLVPFIDADYFVFEYGDPDQGERIIDSQYASSTESIGYVGDYEQLFGVNFADGRIKGYWTAPNPESPDGKEFFVQYVRGDTGYGENEFIDNGDFTVTDNASGLMWLQVDSGEFGVGEAGDGALKWAEALQWAETLEFAGHGDWRLPNIKELQSIVDYTRAPSITESAAIDSIFVSTAIIDELGATNYPYYWSNTTHFNWLDTGPNASYVAFGEALGYLDDEWQDVHGTGAQRSDPKTGDPDDYPQGHGPQGDAIRIYNFVRPVRGGLVGVSYGPDGAPPAPALRARLSQNHPNPFNPHTQIRFELESRGGATLRIFDARGALVTTLVEAQLEAGPHVLGWDGRNSAGIGVPSGLYFYALEVGGHIQSRKMILLK